MVIIDFEEEYLRSNKFPAVCFLWVQIKEPWKNPPGFPRHSGFNKEFEDPSGECHK